MNDPMRVCAERIVETMREPVLLLDADLKVLAANRPFYRTFSLTPQETVGQLLYDLSNVPQLRELLGERLSGDAVVEDVELDYEGPTVGHKALRLNARRIEPTDGGSPWILLAMEDITQRQRAEQALRASEEKLKALFSVLPIGISIVDENRNVVDVNPALERILALSREQLLSGAHAQRAYLRADGTPMPMEEFPSFRAFREQRIVQGTEIGVAKENGEITWVIVGAAPFPMPGLGVAVTTIDITDRKRAQEEREQANQAREAYLSRLDTLIRASAQILAETTTAGLFCRVVEVARALTGARIGIVKYGYQDGVFQGSAALLSNDAPALLGGAFTPQMGGVYRNVLEGEKTSIRLTDEQLRGHPAWQGVPEGHTPLHGLLGVRLVGGNGRACGLVLVSDKAQGDFTAEDEALLAQLAALASLGWQHIEARSEAERRADELSAVFAAMTDAVIVYDAVGRPVRANPAALETFGLDSPSIDRENGIQQASVRTADGRLLSVGDLPSSRALAGGTVHDERLILTNAGGRDLTILVSAAPLRTDGDVSGAVAVWHDITARVQAEERVAWLASYPELNPNPVTEVDSAGGVHYLNPAAQRLFPDLQTAGLQHPWLAGLQPVAEKFRRGETFSIRREVTIREFCYQQELNYVAQSGCIRIYGLDITARERAEESLRHALAESQQRQAEVSALLQATRVILAQGEFAETARAIFDSCKALTGGTAGYVALLSRDGLLNDVLFLDAGGRPCTVDPALPMPIRGLREVAYRAGHTVYDNDFSNSQWTVFLPPGHVGLDNVLFAPLVVEGRTVGVMGLANKLGGFTEHDSRIVSAFGELVAIALYNSRILESLEGSERRFRSVVETASDAIVTGDNQGHIVFWNRAAEQTFGYSQAEAVGQPLALLLPYQFPTRQPNAVERQVAMGEPSSRPGTVETMGRRNDGREFPVELSLATWQSGEAAFSTVVVRDITERRRAEEALEQRSRDLQLLNRLDRELGTTLDLPQVLDRVLRAVQEVVAAAGGSVWLWNEDRPGWLVCRAALQPGGVPSLLNLHLRLGDGIAGWVAQHGDSAIVACAPGDPRFASTIDASLGLQNPCVLAVPLRVGGEVAGVLEVVREVSLSFDARDQMLVETLAAAAAIAIENARLHGQTQQAAAAAERSRLARELHDAVSQTLFSVSVIAESLPRLWERDPEKVRRGLGQLHELTRAALAEMRTLLLELRPAALVEANLDALLRQLAEAMASRAQVAVSVSVEGQPRPLPPDVQVALYRIAQEALNNVTHHARATEATVRLRYLASNSSPAGGGVELRVADNGRGFDPASVRPGRFGLSILRERAEAIGTTLQIDSQAGRGTEIAVTWPGA